MNAGTTTAIFVTILVLGLVSIILAVLFRRLETRGTMGGDSTGALYLAIWVGLGLVCLAAGCWFIWSIPHWAVWARLALTIAAIPVAAATAGLVTFAIVWFIDQEKEALSAQRDMEMRQLVRDSVDGWQQLRCPRCHAALGTPNQLAESAGHRSGVPTFRDDYVLRVHGIKCPQCGADRLRADLP